MNNKDISKILQNAKNTTASKPKKEEEKAPAPKVTANTSTSSVPASKPTQTSSKPTQTTTTKSAQTYTTKSSSPAKTESKQINPNSPEGIKAIHGKDVSKKSTYEEIPSLSSAESDLIDYYESLPDYNAFERLFNKEKAESYNQKQALASDYNTAKNKQNRTIIESSSVSPEDIATIMLNRRSAQFGNASVGKVAYSDAEKRIFDATGLTAKQVLDAYDNDYNAYMSASAKKAPVLSSVSSVLTNPSDSATNVANKVVNWASGRGIKNTPTEASIIRNAVSEDMGDVGKFFYNTGMSAGDMILASAMGGPGLGAGTIMGLEKADSTMNNAVERGLNPNQILLEGGASGLTTALTEAISLGKIDDIAKSGLKGLKGKEFAIALAKKIGASMAAEGLQEGAEDIADAIADAWIAGDKSQINTDIRNYMANGDSEEDATRKAWVNFLKETGMDVLSGAVSGGFFGGADVTARNLTGDVNPLNDALSSVLDESDLENAVLESLTEEENNAEIPTVDDAVADLIQNPVEDNVLNDEDILPLDLFENEEITNENVNELGNPEEITNTDVNNDEIAALAEEELSKNEDSITAEYESYRNDLIQRIQNARNQQESLNLTRELWDLDDEMQREHPELFDNGRYLGSQSARPQAPTQNSMSAMAEEDLTTGMNPDALAILEHYAPESLPDIPQIRADAPAPNADGMTTAQTSRNTFANSPTFNRTQESLKFLEDMQSDGKHKVDIVSEQKSLENARNKLENDYEGTVQDLITKESFGGDDTDASMMILDDYVQDAIETGDYSRVESWTRNIINKIHKAAQGLQALAKYSRTASSMIVKTSKMIETIVDNADSKNKNIAKKTAEKIHGGKLGETTQNLASDIVDAVNDKTNRKTDKALAQVRPYDPNKKVARKKVAEKSHEQIVQEVQKSIDTELPNNSMLEDFSDADADYIATLIEDGKNTREIAQALMLRLTYGDFNYNEEQAPTTTNGIVDSALRRMGYDGTRIEETQEQIHEEIVADIKRSLEKESKSVYKDFTDEDFEYLARLVEHGESAQVIADKITQRLETGLWGFSTEDLKRITEIYNEIDKVNPNSKEAVDLENEAFEIMSKYLGEGTFMEKWNQWRYLAMLGNPRTHLRNIIGNTMFGTVTNIKDAIGAGLETISGTEDRTKAIVSRVANPELFKATDQDFDNNVYALAVGDGNKYTMERGVEAFKKVFHSKLMNKLANFNNNALTNEDTFAIKRKYSRALAGYLKANNLSTDILKGNSEQAQKARAYALNEAKIATFHEDSKLADLLNQISSNARAKGGIGGWAVNTMLESVMPFKKTPINIMKQGVIEYNPLQIANGVIKSLNNAYNKHKGNDTRFDPSDIINSYAKGLTGSMLFGLGMLLAKAGVLRGSGEDDDRFFDEQSYSINIGNKSYTIDWSAPASLPMFVGVELYNWLSGKSAKEGKTIWDAFASMADPMIEMSMLSGLRDAFKSMSYVSDNNAALGSFATNLGVNYLSQALPTIGGQIARTIDPTRRSTYTGKKSGSFSDTVMKSINKGLNKIPGLSTFNQPSLNVWGEEQENVGFDDIIADIAGIDRENIPQWADYLGRLGYNMLSPGYYTNTERNDVEAEIERLTNSEDRNDDVNNLIPSAPDKSYDGERLTPTQYTQISKEQGRLYKEGYEALVNSSKYQSLSDTDKATTMNEVRKFMSALARYNTLGYDITASNYKDNFYAYKRYGIDGVLNNIIGKQELKNNGINTSSKLGKEALASGDVSQYLENDATKIPTLDGGYTYDQKLLTNGGSYVSVNTAIPYLDQLDLSSAERGELLYNTGQRGQKEERAYAMSGYEGVDGYYNIKYYGENTGGSGVARSEIIDYVKSQNPGLSNEELKPIVDAWLSVFDIKTMYGDKNGDY